MTYFAHHLALFSSICASLYESLDGLGYSRGPIAEPDVETRFLCVIGNDCSDKVGGSVRV